MTSKIFCELHVFPWAGVDLHHRHVRTAGHKRTARQHRNNISMAQRGDFREGSAGRPEGLDMLLLDRQGQIGMT